MIIADITRALRSLLPKRKPQVFEVYEPTIANRCPMCRGRGRVTICGCDGDDPWCGPGHMDFERCDFCKGSGRFSCPSCEQEGQLEERVTYAGIGWVIAPDGRQTPHHRFVCEAGHEVRLAGD